MTLAQHWNTIGLTKQTQHTMVIAEIGNTLQNINGMLKKAVTNAGGKLTPENLVVQLGTNDIIQSECNPNRDTDIILNVAEVYGFSWNGVSQVGNLHV